MQFLSPLPSEQFRSISLGLVGLLYTNISSLAGKVCTWCWSLGDKSRELAVKQVAEPLGTLAPGSGFHVLVGTQDCDEL